jgi:hypothetical protein
MTVRALFMFIMSYSFHVLAQVEVCFKLCNL